MFSSLDAVRRFYKRTAAGHAVSIFGVVSIPPLIAENARLSQVASAVHLVGQYLPYFFVALHITGALRHAIFNRDGALERMLPVRSTAQRVRT